MTQETNAVLPPNRHKQDDLSKMLGITYDDPISRIASDLVDGDTKFLDDLVAEAKKSGFWANVAFGNPTWKYHDDPTLAEIAQFAKRNGISYGHMLFIGEDVSPLYSFSSNSYADVGHELMEAIKATRKTRGVSNEEVAENMGISLAAVERFSSSSDIGLTTLRRYALASFLRYEHFLIAKS